MINKGKKTKIVATLGPACSDKNIIKKMINAGVNVFRINFSHADYKTVEQNVKIIRDINRELNYNIENSLYTQDFNQMLNNSELTVNEYNSYYPRIVELIKSDNDTAEAVRKKILDKWSKAKGGPAALSEEDPTSEVLDIWNRLNLLDKGEIMAWIRRLEEE